MKCPKCEEQGKKSRVYPGGGMKTAMYCRPFYDEDGKYHHHDRNIVTSSACCSNGHEMVIKSHDKCPGCDWGGAQEVKYMRFHDAECGMCKGSSWCSCPKEAA